MENVKEGDIRVPLVFTIFFLCEITGGVFLVFYVFLPALSQPWYPTAALILIGSPWLFWIVTYIYTCIKPCSIQRPAAAVDHNISRRQDASRTSREDPEMPLTHSV